MPLAGWPADHKVSDPQEQKDLGMPGRHQRSALGSGKDQGDFSFKMHPGGRKNETLVSTLPFHSHQGEPSQVGDHLNFILEMCKRLPFSCSFTLKRHQDERVASLLRAAGQGSWEAIAGRSSLKALSKLSD